MDSTHEYLDKVKEILREKKERKQIAAYHIVEGVDKPWVQIRTIGEQQDPLASHELKSILKESKGAFHVDSKAQKEIYYLLSQGPRPDSDLSQELRPGSGIIRFINGVPEGPAGTLTCFLSSEDGRDIYLLAAGHVVSDFWQVPKLKPKGSIYHNPKGFPSTNSTRYMGELVYRSDPPPCINHPAADLAVDVDMGIVSLLGDFEWKQRTTCYGTFGEWPDKGPLKPVKEQVVMKCGAEETHWTYAAVESESATVLVYGPNPDPYEFRGQVILRQLDLPRRADRPEKTAKQGVPKPPKASFAVPGDSGTMVVDHVSREPLGMLIAGSSLEGKYVMTPIREILNRWKRHHLVLLRA